MNEQSEKHKQNSSSSSHPQKSTWTERFCLNGKNALVTGGSKGLGEEIAYVLAQAGARVAIVGRDLQRLQHVANNIKNSSGNTVCDTCLVIQADLSTISGAKAAAEEAQSYFEREGNESDGLDGIDILVNNAGIYRPNSILETTMADWEESQATNLRAPLLLAQAIVPKMIERGKGGKIINISSTASLIATENEASYAASKAGLDMLTKTMSVEWGKHNIQCNSICPTVIMTSMGKVWDDPLKRQKFLNKIPMGRFGEPVEVADLTLFLSSSASNWVTGQNIALDGGYSISK